MGAPGWFSNPYSNLKVRFGRGSRHAKKGLFLGVSPVRCAPGRVSLGLGALCAFCLGTDVPLCQAFCASHTPTAWPHAAAQLLQGSMFGSILADALVSPL